ncbi:AP2 domain-containing protein [Endozoicomonas sp. SCSIO W0465]|uniref:AP2 domain-containing protein n=1 Tax=Endozoicomonas sp. SCSIO W0465 TaxID=2918516 RepID=UPI002075FA2C|nr:AP2 domain-containing protein [Endozoicomonas sp. SCSIO W0465]USE36841.1 AP2 domain-containing protein [Endozoicomonas sp. SCSIO W0465]
MKPEQRAFLDEHYPDHHLKFDSNKGVWVVEAYGMRHPFKCGDYKGAVNAKAAAIAFRDSLPNNAFTWSRSYSTQVQSKVQGVFRCKGKGQSNAWRAQVSSIDENGKRVIKAKNFSIAKYGDQEAYDLAVIWRDKLLREKEAEEFAAAEHGRVKETNPSTAGRMR